MTDSHAESTCQLPDVFRTADGSPVTTIEQWRAQREWLASLFAGYEYGTLPPKPSQFQIEPLHQHRYTAYDGAQHRQYLATGMLQGSFQFLLDVYVPNALAPRPVLLTGDGCWCNLTDAVLREALRRSYMVAKFNRLELASDPSPDPGYDGRCSDGDFGAIAAWAWGYLRAVDALMQIPDADSTRIMIAGHSRGGKAVLLAGAMDERIAVTAANASGCAGAACFRWNTGRSEAIADIAGIRPSWFCRTFSEYIDRETDLPIDQHMLLAMVAPRALLITEALDDHWANPPGTWQSYRAARPAYEWLDATHQIGLHYRSGIHDHGYEDYVTALDFADWRMRGIEPVRDFHPDPGPFSHLPRI